MSKRIRVYRGTVDKPKNVPEEKPVEKVKVSTPVVGSPEIRMIDSVELEAGDVVRFVGVDSAEGTDFSGILNVGRVDAVSFRGPNPSFPGFRNVPFPPTSRISSDNGPDISALPRSLAAFDNSVAITPGRDRTVTLPQVQNTGSMSDELRRVNILRGGDQLRGTPIGPFTITMDVYHDEMTREYVFTLSVIYPAGTVSVDRSMIYYERVPFEEVERTNSRDLVNLTRTITNRLCASLFEGLNGRIDIEISRLLATVCASNAL